MRQAAHRGFDFGKFGHRIARPARIELPARQGRAKRGAMTEDTVSFGYADVAPEDKTRMVGDVFQRVAARYDIMNDAMSGGMHRLWKDQFVRRVKPRAGEEILDMAGGTGDIAFRLARAGAGVHVADINPAMLSVGMERARKKGIEGLIWGEQNAERLTFDDKSFDAYTIAFGIRNVTDIPAALREAHRVLKRGGRFFCLEFSTTTWPGFKELYDTYSHRLVPKVGKLIAQDEESYRYLIESIRRFPDMPTFKAMIGEAGFVNTKVEPILGGLVAIHSGWKI
jgi:demethylmenaquinone methyltransferase/2-methoxy-6-polyprenyl-1,4-benzoquinol methylase